MRWKDVPEWALWLGGFAIPAVGALAYHHFVADPTDVVTDVRQGAQGTITIIYSAGPSQTITLPPSVSAWSALAAGAAKSALAGVNRSRVQATLQQLWPS